MGRSYKDIIQHGARSTTQGPSDHVWDNISKELFAEKKKNNLLWLLLPLLLISLLIGAFIYVDQSSSHNAADTSAIDISISNLQDEESYPIASDQSITSTSKATYMSKPSIQLDEPYTDIPQNQMSSTSTLIGNSSNVKNAQKSAITAAVEGTSVDTRKIDEDILTTNVSKQKSKLSIAKLSSNFSQLSWNQQKINISKEFTIIPDKSSSRLLPSVGALLSFHHNTTNNRIDATNALNELVDYADFKDHFSAAITASIPISSRFELNTGIGYFESQSVTTYDIALDYHKINESHDPSSSEYVNNFQHSLPCLAGDINTELSFRRSDHSDIGLQETVGIDLHTTTNDQTVFVPLTLRYYSKDNYQGIFIQGGIIGGYAIDRTFDIDQLVTSHTDIYLSDAEVSSPEFGSRFNIQSVLGVGFTKHISNRAQLDASLNYQNSVSGNLSNGYLQTSIGIRFQY